MAAAPGSSPGPAVAAVEVAGPPQPSIRAPVLGLIAGQCVLVVGGIWIIVQHPITIAAPGPGLIVGYSLAIVLLSLLPPVNVEFRRHAVSITPGDAAVLVGLFVVGPLLFVASGMLAEVISILRQRQTPLKASFNFVSTMGGLVAASATFSLLGLADPTQPAAWLAGLAALATLALWDLLSTASVMSIAEDLPWRSTLMPLAPAVSLSLVVSGLLGLAAVLLYTATPFGPLLLAPVFVILAVSTWTLAFHQTERSRFERLYQASSGLAQLVSRSEMLELVAAEARTLLTGASAVCCLDAPDGEHLSVWLDDAGARPATEIEVAALRQVIGGVDQGQVAAPSNDRSAWQHLPMSLSVSWAVRRSETTGEIVVAVFRELPPDPQQGERPGILAAFLAHADAVISNVTLHDQVRAALDRQVAFNLQKGEFVAAVSHELRTPLTAIIGSMETATRFGSRLPAQTRDELQEMALRHGVRLQSLVEDLLLVAAADHEQLGINIQSWQVADLFAAFQDELQLVLAQRLIIEIPPGLREVMADEQMLRRILINLAENARKYAPEGAVRCTAFMEADMIVIAVSDQGPGIAPDDRERIFEQFVQLDQSTTRQQGGTGLGLFLCRELAYRLGGSITADAGPEGGARFLLRLPAAGNRPFAER